MCGVVELQQLPNCTWGETRQDALDTADLGREGKWWRKGVGGYGRGRKNPINRELDGCGGTKSRSPALETSRVPSRGLESAPYQLQGCSRSGLELSPSELIIMKKHSARVAPLSACNSPVLTLTKVEGRGEFISIQIDCDPASWVWWMSVDPLGVFCLTVL